MVNVTLMSFKIGLHIESSQPKNCSFPIDILIENCTFVDNIYDTILTFFLQHSEDVSSVTILAFDRLDTCTVRMELVE